MDSPQFTKVHPLRPIVSSRGCISNTQEIAEYVKNIEVSADECMTSCDVTTLLTSVQVEPAIQIIKRKLEEDKEIQWKNYYVSIS